MGNRKPLLILHGALGAFDQFDAITRQLDSSYEVFRFNFSGHGGKPFQADFSINQFASELDTYITDNRLKGIDIFGYSMGGYVALELASRRPDQVGRLHTLGTKFNWTPETAASEVRMLDPHKIQEKVPAFAEALTKRHAPNDWHEVLNKTRTLMLDLGANGAMAWEKFNTIQTDVIIGIGDQDNMVSLDESAEVANRLPNGTLKVFKGFKHPIEQIESKLLIESLIDFFG